MNEVTQENLKYSSQFYIYCFRVSKAEFTMSAEFMEIEMGVKEKEVAVRADSDEDEEASEFEVELTDDSGESMDSDAALEKVSPTVFSCSSSCLCSKLNISDIV